MAKPDRAETEAEAVEAVEAAGYVSPTNMVQHGATWHCDAQDASGAPVSLLIDGKGDVKEKGDDDSEVEPPATEA